MRVFFLAVGGVAAHAPYAYLAHSRFRPTTEAYSQGKFLANAFQHPSSLKSAPSGKLGFEPTTLWLYVVWLRASFLAAQVRTVPDGSDRPTAIVSKAECKSSYKPQQPQPSSNISLPLARDYSPCKGGQIIYKYII